MNIEPQELKELLYEAYESGINDYRENNGYSRCHKITHWLFQFDKWFKKRYPKL